MGFFRSAWAEHYMRIEYGAQSWCASVSVYGTIPPVCVESWNATRFRRGPQSPHARDTHRARHKDRAGPIRPFMAAASFGRT